jgi:hypothetical protein
VKEKEGEGGIRCIEDNHKQNYSDLSNYGMMVVVSFL